MTVHRTLRKLHIFRYMNNFMPYIITRDFMGSTPVHVPLGF